MITLDTLKDWVRRMELSGADFIEVEGSFGFDDVFTIDFCTYDNKYNYLETLERIDFLL